ncbi:uncharacterized protein [Chanodichthys erythropterus]|uniref:uncharacterized protein isoform X3 n=1 Tax=Chanodichthys erythropterus TaxID=933992 RepID=UPI00351ED49B
MFCFGLSIQRNVAKGSGRLCIQMEPTLLSVQHLFFTGSSEGFDWIKMLLIIEALLLISSALGQESGENHEHFHDQNLLIMVSHLFSAGTDMTAPEKQTIFSGNFGGFD